MVKPTARLLAACFSFFALILAACTTAGEPANPGLPGTGSTVETRPAGAPAACQPSQPDMLGPFYEPDAPVRDKVGEGYILQGTVLSAGSCTPITDAVLEFWMAGPDGEYRDEYRATLFSSEAGQYRFQSHFPPPYSGRPPHIHIRATAPGYRELVTQHYPSQGDEEAVFDLVLNRE